MSDLVQRLKENCCCIALSMQAADRIEQLEQREATLHQRWTEATEKHNAALAKIASLERSNKELLSLLGRANRQIYAWAEAYGRHNPKWLPPSGDVRLLEDISEALDAALSAADANKGKENG